MTLVRNGQPRQELSRGYKSQDGRITDLAVETPFFFINMHKIFNCLAYLAVVIATITGDNYAEKMITVKQS